MSGKQSASRQNISTRSMCPNGFNRGRIYRPGNVRVAKLGQISAGSIAWKREGERR